MSQSNATREAMAKEVREWLSEFNDDRLSLWDLITDLVKNTRAFQKKLDKQESRIAYYEKWSAPALARRDALLREVLKQLREDSSFDLHVRIERELGDSHD